MLLAELCLQPQAQTAQRIPLAIPLAPRPLQVCPPFSSLQATHIALQEAQLAGRTPAQLHSAIAHPPVQRLRV